MKRARIFAVALAVVSAALATSALGQTQNVPKGFDAFRLLRTRNVFDPERRPIPAAGAPVARVESRPTRSDYVALTGILVTNEKALAFFSGSRADYSQVLSVNGEIAGAKVLKITPANVEVERNGQRLSVAVGQTVPLDGSAPAAAPAEVSAAPVQPENSQNPNPAPANVSDALRRMMERRQQELK